MKTLFAFLKKEFLETIRTNKLLILLILFTAIGIMNPAIAKITPWMLKLLEDELGNSGIIIDNIQVDALTSWTQFFKNIPIALIAFIFIYSSTLTKEYESNSLVIILTKGFSRYKVILAKFINILIMWTIGYFLSFIITYLYNSYYWDNTIAKGLMEAIINWYVFGIFTIGIMILFSVIGNNYSSVLLLTGITVFGLYTINFIPKLKKYNPINLTSSNNILLGIDKLTPITIIIALIISLLSILLSIKLFNKKSL